MERHRRYVRPIQHGWQGEMQTPEALGNCRNEVIFTLSQAGRIALHRPAIFKTKGGIMPNVNKVFLMGHMTRDVEIRYLPNETAVGSFGIAVNRKWKDAGGREKEEVLFVDLSVFGRQAEV